MNPAQLIDSIDQVSIAELDDSSGRSAGTTMPMTTLVIVIGILAAAGTIAWFLFNRQNPERSASHGERTTETTSEQLYGGADRPAGPDATTMDPDALGGDHRPPEA